MADPVIHHDMGYRSRKFWFAGYAITILFLAMILAKWIETVVVLYGTFALAVGGVVTAYLTGNVAQQFVAGKKDKAEPPEQSPS